MLQAHRLAPAVVLLVASLSGCAPRLPPCASDTDCARGHECLASRCRWLGSDPVAPATLRTVLEPSAMALLGAPPADAPGHLPGTVILGAAAGPRVLWLLAFELPALGEVDSALLLLEPTRGALQDPADVELRAWRVTAPWSATEVRDLAAPPLAPPRATAIARGTPASTVRLDVTAHVRRWRAEPRENHGLGLEGAGPGSLGVVLDTGVDGGTRPRLEIYAGAR